MSNLSGRILRERYRVVRRVGEGAMSEVYFAVHVRNPERRYAIKVLKSELAHQAAIGHRFRAESDVLRRLAHPGILKVHELFEEGGSLCMALDFVEGQSLADLLDSKGAMAPYVALPMFQMILAALDFAHRAGIIHRDIKPSNILIDRRGRPQLCDFGIARQVGRRGITGAGMTLGTPHYMSPEQIQSPQDIDHRSDLYSAGVMLYEMLTGKVPFGEAATDSDFSILQQHMHAIPPDPHRFAPDLDDSLCRVLEKALRKDRDRRFQGASEFWQAIEYALVHDAPPPEEPPEEPARKARTKPSLAEDPVATTTGHHYAVYRDAAGGGAAVRLGFSWPALGGDFAWMFGQRLYLHGMLWLVCWVVLLALWWVVHSGPMPALQWGVALAALGIKLLPGLRGNLWLEDALHRSGHVRIGEVQAASPAAADERTLPANDG